MRSLSVRLVLCLFISCAASVPPFVSLSVVSAPTGGEAIFGLGESVEIRLTIVNPEDTAISISSYVVRLVAPLSAVEHDTNTLINESIILDPPSTVPVAQEIHLGYDVIVTENMTARPGRYQLVFSVPDLDLNLTTAFSVRASR